MQITQVARLRVLTWCSFAVGVNVPIVTEGGASGFTLRSYGDGVGPAHRDLEFLSYLKPALHDADTDTDIPERILADTSDTRDFLKLILWQAEQHADILATMSVSASWNSGLNTLTLLTVT